MNVNDFLLRLLHLRGFVLRDDHVIYPNGKSGTGCVSKPELLDAIEHLDCGLKAETQISVIDELAESLLLEQAVDVRHAFGKMVVQNRAADRGVHETALILYGLGVEHVLVVISLCKVHDFPAHAQFDGRKGFHFVVLKCKQNFFHVCEGAAFTLGSDLCLGEVIDAKHHVLCGNGDGLS